MISETQVRELLAQKAETKNLDFKQSFNWDTASFDEKCELVKDILAFMNTQDGGQVIIGVEDSTFRLIGLCQDDFSSFDTTKVNDFLHRYTDPSASCEVQKLSADGLNLAVLSIPEFRDVPIICKRDANSSKETSRLILRAGGLYVRTEKATSVIVPSSEEMRDLMNRALLKRGDQLLGTIENLLRGKTVTKEPDTLKYSKEIAASHVWFKEVLPADFEKHGYWRLVSMPQDYRSERIPDITTVLKFLSESEVSLRGWNFPHTDKDTKSNFSSGRESYTVFHRYLEAYRAYQSGLFIWQGAYRENEPDFVNRYGKALSFVNVIYEITEMFVFLKRYYERVSPEDSIHVSIELTDIKDRSLAATDVDSASLLGSFYSREPSLWIDRDYTVSEVRASAEELAIKVVKKIFEVFNWNSPDPNMIRGWQQRLLSRTL
ncbi:MAG TPA: ATP-binding protein [Terriglobales bacterium]|jgi:hypothetical protein|nr:ATP-binding protein [Terriglobales bacterium]